MFSLWLSLFLLFLRSSNLSNYMRQGILKLLLDTTLYLFHLVQAIFNSKHVFDSKIYNKSLFFCHVTDYIC